MPIKRNLKQLSSMVLGWLLFSLGVAMVSPLVKTPDFSMICSGAGMVKVLFNSDDADTHVATLDCPLCGPSGAPTSESHPLVHSRDFIVKARLYSTSQPVAQRTAAALPARGPPQFL